MEGTIAIMGDTQIATEAIQVMATGVTQAMVMEDPNNNQNNGYPGNSFGAPRSD